MNQLTSIPCTTCAQRKKMLELMGEDSIVFQDQVGLFKIMTSLEMPKVQKELIWGVPDRVVAQVYPYLILLQHTRQGLNKEEWEQKKEKWDEGKIKRDKETNGKGVWETWASIRTGTVTWSIWQDQEQTDRWWGNPPYTMAIDSTTTMESRWTIPAYIV